MHVDRIVEVATDERRQLDDGDDESAEADERPHDAQTERFRSIGNFGKAVDRRIAKETRRPRGRRRGRERAERDGIDDIGVFFLLVETHLSRAQ